MPNLSTNLAGAGNVRAESIVSTGPVTATQHIATTDALGFTFASDTDTGLTRSAANALAVVTGGATRITASNGDVAVASGQDLRFGGALAGNGAVTPAQIAADQNNYAGISSTVSVARLSSDLSRNVTGLTGGFFNRILFLFNVGAANIVLTNEDALSTAGNRFLTTTGVSLTVTPNRVAQLIYDTTSSRWRASLI